MENSDGGGIDAADSRWVGAVFPSSCISRAPGLKPGPEFGKGFTVGLVAKEAAAGWWKPWGSFVYWRYGAQWKGGVAGG